MKKRDRRRRGAVIVWVAVSMIALLGCVGLALDTARVLLVAHELQTAADAGALAGAQFVRTDAVLAMLSARSTTEANDAEGDAILLPDNPGNDPGGKVVLGRFDRETRTFTATLTAPNAVKVIACRTTAQNGALPLIFGPIFNVADANVKRQAIAMIGGGTGAGLIALNKTDRAALSISGTVTLEVDGGAIQVDSIDSRAIDTNGGPTINAPEINVVGDAAISSNTIYSGDVNPNSPYVPDPLAYLTAPNWEAMTDYGGVSVTGSSAKEVQLEPGYYPQGISMTNNFGTLRLAPGIYVLDGPGLKVTGGNMYAHGVMFYVKGTGVIDLEGNGVIQVTPIDPTKYSYPSGTEDYEGISFFQDSPSNTVKTASKLVGTNDMLLEGTLYFRNNEIHISGTSQGFGNQLIADTVTISGTGFVRINYDGRNPAAGNRVFLVQ
jgi:hypothetical protein